MSNGKKLYVGNLPYTLTSDQLRELFAEAGSIADVVVISDRATGRSKGFGFVEFASDAEAAKAVEMFNGKDVQGRPLVVNVARPKEENPRSNYGSGSGSMW
ncbi:hypothetical protein A2892_03030 [Candidatus Woesebacteria bacterium RIFCSPLOWO2_01_FULL_39_10b]|uniref:RRM domain-containing protein n=1 Tax=Candidatus Woesebacteria bacterium RIFCSPLOWO2_01_FULL_39_10b TaxID=1802517 RepID=A0A1F8B9X7_9BACT|nr:MAG: hypothetical protein A2892_03030 [Candidatus Woesebacteria bacterium RIFCSPLOWO2_01_FULL_39_10b]